MGLKVGHGKMGVVQFLSDLIVIPESALSKAIRRRAFLAVAIMLYCALGLVAPRLALLGPMTFLGWVHLLISSLLARRWNRESGMWLLYLLLASFSIWMWWGFRKPSPPPPSASLSMLIAIRRDEIACAFVAMINVRLLASAIVANLRLSQTTSRSTNSRSESTDSDGRASS